MCEKDGEITLKERYQLIINARNFHYDNFNKWMTYFYVAIGALFVGYCTIVSSEKISTDRQNMLEYLILVLGFIVSILWYWSSKGYYYWNINFITLVNHYEKDILKFKETERVYFVFANTKTQNNYGNPVSGANISTSKVAILFSYLISGVWGLLVFHKLINSFNYFCLCNGVVFLFSLILSFIVIHLLSIYIPEKFLISKITHFPDLKIIHEDWEEEQKQQTNE